MSVDFATTTQEYWRTIEGFSWYMVSNFGRVLSLARQVFRDYPNYKNHPKWYKKANTIISGTWHKGYRTVMLHDYDSRIRRRYIHRMVGVAFLPNPENKKCVEHIDGDRSNNHVKNLRWTDYCVWINGQLPTPKRVGLSVTTRATN